MWSNCGKCYDGQSDARLCAWYSTNALVAEYCVRSGEGATPAEGGDGTTAGRRGRAAAASAEAGWHARFGTWHGVSRPRPAEGRARRSVISKSSTVELSYRTLTLPAIGLYMYYKMSR